MEWLPDSTLLVHNEQRDHHVYSADGTLLRTIELEFDEWTRTAISDSEPIMVAAGRAPGSAEPFGFQLIDLRTGDVTPLPPPLNRLESEWKPLTFAGASLYFYLADAGNDRVLRYDLDADALSPVKDVRLSSDDGVWVRSLMCLDDCRTFAVSFDHFDHRNGGAVFIIRDGAAGDGRPSITVVENSKPSDYRGRGIHAWSPDGTRLLLRQSVELLPYDDQGFAVLPHRQPQIAETTWRFVEYQVVDSADGRIMHRFRVPAGSCGRSQFRHRGELSPDGLWLVIAPESMHCK